MVGTNATADLAERLTASARELLRRSRTPRPAPVAQLEAATTTGSVFVVRDGERVIAATTSPEPTVGLVFYDLKSCVRSVDPGHGRRARPVRSREKFFTGVVLAAGSLAGSVLVRRRAARRVDHVDLYAGDGSMVSYAEGDAAADGSARRGTPAARHP